MDKLDWATIRTMDIQDIGGNCGLRPIVEKINEIIDVINNKELPNDQR